MGKLLALVDKDGLEGPVDKSITHALGLTADSEVLTLRQYGQMESSQLHHFFNRLQGNRRPGGSAFLLMRLDTVSARVYLLRPDLTLVAAVSRKTNQAPVALSDNEARKDVVGELRFWSGFVDRL